MSHFYIIIRMSDVLIYCYYSAYLLTFIIDYDFQNEKHKKT